MDFSFAKEREVPNCIKVKVTDIHYVRIFSVARIVHVYRQRYLAFFGKFCCFSLYFHWDGSLTHLLTNLQTEQKFDTINLLQRKWLQILTP